MAGSVKKSHEVAACYAGRHRIDERMKIENVVRHHPFFEQNLHGMAGIVHSGEGGHGTGCYAQMGVQQFRSPEGEAVHANEPGQGLQIDPALLERHKQEKLAGFVLQKQVFGMAARNVDHDIPAFLNREHRRVMERAVVDAMAIEKGEQVVGAGRQIDLI